MTVNPRFDKYLMMTQKTSKMHIPSTMAGCSKRSTKLTNIWLDLQKEKNKTKNKTENKNREDLNK